MGIQTWYSHTGAQAPQIHLSQQMASDTQSGGTHAKC